MTDEKIFEQLSHILTEISEDEYPEMYSTICANIDEETGYVYSTAYYIATELHEADNAKQMPKCVADFVMAAYEEELAGGNADAACDIGSLYYTGRCGEQNYTKALEYYTISAKGGCRQAQENLGYCYYYGRDTAVDYEKAFHYFALGAFDGHLRSLYKIGDMYRNGFYVEKNPQEAFHIYSRCVETMTEMAIPQVGADVMMRMGDCYFEGIGVEVNYMSAMEYYQKAERMFFERLKEGDFLIKGCYDKVIRRQAEARKKMQEQLPSFDWVE